MNYPVWYLPEIGGSTLIALIAIFHVFVSHFAVGGGLYLVFAEKKGLREQNQGIVDFTQRHARFFLLVTMVFGSISGVGIWFVISLVHPAATSLLTHHFVFAWAAEWVFFLVELAAAFVYFYTFGKMDSRTHLRVGWLYFCSAWASLALINGIIGVMLTPGGWLVSGSFWQGLFNPSFVPSLLFRTSVAITLAGCYGYLTSAWSVERSVRLAMSRFSALWSLAGLGGAVITGLWYLQVLPDPARRLMLGASPTIATSHDYGLISTLLLLALSLVVGIVRPSLNSRPVAVVAILCAFCAMGSFEWSREASRRPYVLNGLMYSNGMLRDSVATLNERGYLATAKWVQQRSLTPENRQEAGRELYIHQCYSCHTLGGINNDIGSRTKNMSYQGLISYIKKIHEVRYFMPPFAGTDQEAAALAAFIAGGLHGREIVETVSHGPGGVATGEMVFEDHCAACHDTEEMTEKVSDWNRAEIYTALGELDELVEDMPPFEGTEAERNILADYLETLKGEQ